MSTESFEDEGYTFTDVSDPGTIDALLDKNSFLIDKWNRMLAWHKAQWDWRNDQFVLAEAKAVMEYDGPAAKARFYANNDPDVIMARTYRQIAKAQLTICERRIDALTKEAINLASRNKALMQQYNTGGGRY